MAGGMFTSIIQTNLETKSRLKFIQVETLA